MVLRQPIKKALGSKHNQVPRAITVDKNPAYPIAIGELKNDRILPQNVSLRQIKYLNNIIEQDHRSIKRIVRPMSVSYTHLRAPETDSYLVCRLLLEKKKNQKHPP